MSETYPVEATPDRPELAVRVAGADVDPTVRLDILEVDVTEEVGRHGRATLLVRNWDVAQRAVKHSDSDTFMPGTGVEIMLGYHDELTTVFDGIVTGLDARFGGAGAPTLAVQCRSRSILLDGPRRSRVREDLSDGDFAAEAASLYGLAADSADRVGQTALVQHRTTDWDYLVARAETLGYVVYVRGDTLVFRMPSPPREPLSLSWGRTLLELDLRQDLRRSADPWTATAWDTTDVAAVTSEAAASDSALGGGDRPLPGDALESAQWPEHAGVLPSAAPLDPLEIERVALGAADRAVLGHIAGQGRTIGLPTLTADSWLEILDVGARLGGPHYVTAVRHRLGRHGFSTEFQVGLPMPLAPPAARPPSGLVLGVVEDLDDPESLARVKVSFPWRSDAPEPVWARIATLDAGPSQGSLFVPDVGQEVLVGHVDDDPRHPVVLGALWNGQQAPPESVDAQRNDIRTITTRSGHSLRFDDAEPGAITITTAGGHVASFDDAGEHIQLKDSGGNSVTISQDGIALEAAQGDIVLKAPAGKVTVDTSGFEAKSTGPAKVESTATLDLKASASLSVNGALVRIN